MTLKFEGYTELPVLPDDEIVAKFRALNLDVAWPALAHDIESVEEMNDQINGLIKYLEEASGFDIWQSPHETLMKKTGDCEDYAILKYAILLASGFNQDDLRIVVGEIKSISGNLPHAWLAVHIDDEWIVLDSKFDITIPVKDYLNWQPIVSLNRTQASRWGLQFRMSDITDYGHGKG